MNSLTIGKKEISDYRTYIIAEAGGNHHSDMKLVERMIYSAAEAGADAIKFQSFRPENLVTDRSYRPGNDLENREKLIDVYRKIIKLTESDYEKIVELCASAGIEFLSTPFDLESVDMLERLGVPAYKIASGDITNKPLLVKVAKQNKPIFLSTGASDIFDIEAAVEVLNSQGNEQIAILHCILSYPTKDEDANLRSITAIQKAFPQYLVGLSDHSVADASVNIPSAAVALGARIIEKHFTILSKDIMECDHRLSANQSDLKVLVENTRIIEKALGKETKVLFESETRGFKEMRRSLVANRDIRKDEVLAEDMIGIKRPNDGVSPMHYDSYLGRKAVKDIKMDELLSEINVGLA